REFGTHRTPNFVMDVYRQGAKVGQPVILFRTSDTDPAEDINASFQGLTSDFFGAGLVSSAVELHYGAGLGLSTTPPGPNGNGYPTDKPRPQLITQNLTGFTGNFLVPVLGTVNDNQLWGADFGVLR